MADNVLATPPKKQRERYRPELLKILDDYAARVANDFTSGLDRSAQGFGEMVDDGNYLTGVPRLALGGLQWMGSPVSAAVSPILGPVLQPVGEAVNTYVGQPVERATGYPADITNELFLTGVTAGAGPLLKPALKGTGNFLATMGDAAEAGLNRVGYTARPQEGVRFTFGGPMALTADKAKLAQAQKMAADGLSRDEIWKQTGWFQGVDGKWRFEIDDSNFNLRPNILEEHQNSRIGSTLTVGLTDAIDAPDLLSAYNLGDTTLDLSRLSKGGIGGFDRAKNLIELMAAPDADIMRRGLLHEVQHLIQQKEGFTGGGDPSKLGADKYKRLGGEVEARNVEARRNFTPAQRSAITPWATQDVPFEGQHLATAQQGLQRSGFGSVKLANDEGILAYHGSPHSFDKFSMDKIGTGEGAQAYGHGLYFAEAEDVAKTYRDMLSEQPTALPALDWKQRANWTELQDDAYGLADRALEELQIDIAQGGSARPNWTRLTDKVRQLAPSGKENEILRELDTMADKYGWKEFVNKNPGSMYQVKINVKPDELLDWDKPLSEQPKNIAEAALSIRNQAALEDYKRRGTPQHLIDEYIANANKRAIDGNMTGGSIVKVLKENGLNAAATERLRAAGVKGIKYKDAVSRDSAGGTFNYVIFDDKLITILKKYGIPMTAGAGGAMMVSGEAMPPEVAAQLQGGT